MIFALIVLAAAFGVAVQIAGIAFANAEIARRTDEGGGNVVPFPRPPLPADNAPRRATADGAEFVDGAGRSFAPMTTCEGVVHVFAETPGRCQCGSDWWDGEVQISGGPAA